MASIACTTKTRTMINGELTAQVEVVVPPKLTTVAELIRQLKAMPQDLVVCTIDSEWGWGCDGVEAQVCDAEVEYNERSGLYRFHEASECDMRKNPDRNYTKVAVVVGR